MAAVMVNISPKQRGKALLGGEAGRELWRGTEIGVGRVAGRHSARGCNWFSFPSKADLKEGSKGREAASYCLESMTPQPVWGSSHFLPGTCGLTTTTVLLQD